MSIPSPPRRKGFKNVPKLPLSAFQTPPNSSKSETFPLPHSPSALQPDKIIDSNVVVTDGDTELTRWKKEFGEPLAPKICGVVLSLSEVHLLKAIKRLESRVASNEIIALVLPFTMEDPESFIKALLSESSLPLSLSTVFTRSSPEAIAGLRWALETGRPVDIDIQATLSDSVLEDFEDMLAKATADLPSVPPIILSNILPPPHDLDLPIVKLMNHPTYLAFQSQTAALSLIPSACIKYLPPVWNAPTPHTPLPGVISSPSSDSDVTQQQEWKRRIKMYLGPVMEAFGYQRIIFGSSPSPSSRSSSNAADWYEIAREAVSELGVEQDFVDAIFYGNARRVYEMVKKPQ